MSTSEDYSGLIGWWVVKETQNDEEPMLVGLIVGWCRHKEVYWEVLMGKHLHEWEWDPALTYFENRGEAQIEAGAIMRRRSRGTSVDTVTSGGE